MSVRRRLAAFGAAVLLALPVAVGLAGVAAAVPAAPKSFTAARVTATPKQITLGWKTVTDADHYVVEVLRDDVAIAPVSLPAGSTGHVVDGSDPCVTYKVRVSAVDAGGSGTSTAYATIKTLAPGVVPGMTTGRSDPTTGTVYWREPSHPGYSAVTGYRMHLTRDADDVVMTDRTVTELSHSLPGLDPARTYTLQVTSVNAWGACATATSPIGRWRPADPVGLTATRRTGAPSTVDVSWTPAASQPSPAYYQLGYGLGSPTTTVRVDAPSTSAVLTLDASKAWALQVRSYNEYGGSGAASTTLGVYVAPTTSPSVTPSVTPSGAPSAAPPAAPSGSPSAEPSISPSPTASAMPSISAAPSISPVPEPSISTAPSSEPTPEASISPNPSVSPSTELSLSPPPSAIPSTEPSLSPAPSLSPDQSLSPTPSLDPTPSEAPSSSPSSTPSESAGPAPSESPAPSVTPAPAESPTPSPIPMPSAAPDSPEPAGTPTPAAGPSPVPSATPDPSAGPSPVPAPSDSPEPSTSPSLTPSTDPSPAPSTDPSPAPSTGPEPTSSTGLEPTPAADPHSTPTDGPSPMPTAADPSPTPTPSPAPTPAASAGVSPTPSRTPVVVYHQDNEPPRITAVLSPPAGDDGWSTVPTTVRFTCADSQSVVLWCPVDIPVIADGAGQSFTGIAIDGAGNTALTTITVNLDRTTPEITATVIGARTATGWYTSPPLIRFACTDAGSGVSSCPPDRRIIAEGAAVTVTGATTDRAGHVASTTIRNLKIDLTAPRTTITGVAPFGPYPRLIGVAPVCVTTDAVSGVARRATLTVTIAAAGRRTATCAGALDRAGRAAGPVAITYVVERRRR